MSTTWETSDVNQRLREYESLLEIGVELASSLDLTQVLGLALDRAEKLCRAETSSIWEVDDSSRELFFRVVRGEAASAIRNLRVPMGQGIVGSVALSGRGEVINDVRSDSRWRGDLASSFKTRAILTVPLFAAGRVVGVLQLLNPVGKEQFDVQDLERMRLFAGPLGQAIDNARLYTALKSQYLSTVTALAEAVEKPLGHAEAPAEPPHVLTEDEHVGIPFHFLCEGLVEGLQICFLGHDSLRVAG